MNNTFNHFRESRLLGFAGPTPEPKGLENLYMREGADVSKNKYAYDQVQDRIAKYVKKIEDLKGTETDVKFAKKPLLSGKSIAETIMSIPDWKTTTFRNTTPGQEKFLFSFTSTNPPTVIYTHDNYPGNYRQLPASEVAALLGNPNLVNSTTKKPLEISSFGANFETGKTDKRMQELSKNPTVPLTRDELTTKLFWKVDELEKHYTKVEAIIAKLEESKVDEDKTLKAELKAAARKKLDAQISATETDGKLQTIQIDEFSDPFQTIKSRAYHLLRLPQSVTASFVDSKGEPYIVPDLETIELSGGYQYLKLPTSFTTKNGAEFFGEHRLVLTDKEKKTTNTATIKKNEFNNLIFTFEKVEPKPEPKKPGSDDTVPELAPAPRPVKPPEPKKGPEPEPKHEPEPIKPMEPPAKPGPLPEPEPVKPMKPPVEPGPIPEPEPNPNAPDFAEKEIMKHLRIGKERAEKEAKDAIEAKEKAEKTLEEEKLKLETELKKVEEEKKKIEEDAKKRLEEEKKTREEELKKLEEEKKKLADEAQQKHNEELKKLEEQRQKLEEDEKKRLEEEKKTREEELKKLEEEKKKLADEAQQKLKAELKKVEAEKLKLAEEALKLKEETEKATKLKEELEAKKQTAEDAKERKETVKKYTGLLNKNFAKVSIIAPEAMAPKELEERLAKIQTAVDGAYGTEHFDATLVIQAGEAALGTGKMEYIRKDNVAEVGVNLDDLTTMSDIALQNKLAEAKVKLLAKRDFDKKLDLMKKELPKLRVTPPDNNDFSLLIPAMDAYTVVLQGMRSEDKKVLQNYDLVRLTSFDGTGVVHSDHMFELSAEVKTDVGATAELQKVLDTIAIHAEISKLVADLKAQRGLTLTVAYPRTLEQSKEMRDRVSAYVQVLVDKNEKSNEQADLFSKYTLRVDMGEKPFIPPGEKILFLSTPIADTAEAAKQLDELSAPLRERKEVEKSLKMLQSILPNANLSMPVSLNDLIEMKDTIRAVFTALKDNGPAKDVLGKCDVYFNGQDRTEIRTANSIWVGRDINSKDMAEEKIKEIVATLSELAKLKKEYADLGKANGYEIELLVEPRDLKAFKAKSASLHAALSTPSPELKKNLAGMTIRIGMNDYKSSCNTYTKLLVIYPTEFDTFENYVKKNVK